VCSSLLYFLSHLVSLKLQRRWAQNVFEDIYISIYKTDGFESAFKLRSRIDRVARRRTGELPKSFDEMFDSIL
jgi:hypothetical protein